YIGGIRALQFALMMARLNRREGTMRDKGERGSFLRSRTTLVGKRRAFGVSNRPGRDASQRAGLTPPLHHAVKPPVGAAWVTVEQSKSPSARALSKYSAAASDPRL